MTTNILSILIPVYNAQNNIERLIRSLQESKYKNNFEIICVDDGSKDDSYSILKRLAKEFSNVNVVHQENAGVSAARNAALSQATGLYVFFIDADDAIRIFDFDRVMQKIYRNDDDLAIFGIEDHFLYDNGKERVRQNYATEKQYDQASFFEDFGRILNKHIMYSPCNKIYKKCIIDENHIAFDTNYAICEDILFNLCYLYHVEKISMYQDYVYIYYHEMGKATSGSSRYHADEWEIFLHVVEEIKNLLDEKKAFDQNITWYHTFIVRKLSASLNQKYTKNSPLTNEEKKTFLHQMYTYPIVKEALEDKHVQMDEKDQKLLHMLHKHHASPIIHALYKIRNR